MAGKVSPCLANDIFIIQVDLQPKTPIDPSADASTCFCQRPWVRRVLSSGNSFPWPLRSRRPHFVRFDETIFTVGERLV